MIEIKKSDKIYEDIEFLDYDYYYIKKGYIIYEDADIFSVDHPKGEETYCSIGKIKKLNDFEFDHNISIYNRTSGCPIILLTNDIK